MCYDFGIGWNKVTWLFHLHEVDCRVPLFAPDKIEAALVLHQVLRLLVYE